TYYSWNFVIPSFIRQAEALTQRDIGKWAAMQLGKHRGLQLSKYCLHADSVQLAEPEPNAPIAHELQLGGVAFVELAHRTEIVHYGTAREATFTVSMSHRQRPLVSAELRGVRLYEPEKGELAFERLPIEQEVPRQIREKLAFLDLPTLLDFSKAPQHISDMMD